MRRFILIAVVTTVLTGVSAIPATAAFDSHFDVLSKQTSVRGHGEGFVVKEDLLDPNNPDNKVGWDRAFCKVLNDELVFCRGVFHLNGEIGGEGTIRVSGKIGPGHTRLTVNAGGGDFNGAAGKVVLGDPRRGRNYELNEFSLVR